MTRCCFNHRSVLLAAIALLAGCHSAPTSSDAPPALGVAAASTSAAAPATPAAAHARGVEFLINHQNRDGSWGTFESARPGEIYLGTIASFRAFRDATTALCIMALREPAHHDPAARAALERGVNHLLQAESSARATADTFYDTWTHTFMVQALAEVHGDSLLADRRGDIAKVLQREITILSKRQGAEGGWGYYDFGFATPVPTGNMSTSFNTASAVLALHEARRAGFVVDRRVLDAGLESVERMRLPSGAYVYGTYAQLNPGALYNRVKGSLGRSQPCNLALYLHGRAVTAADLRAGIEAMREHHHFMAIGRGRPYPHEAWYFTAGYYFLYGHYYGARVINQLTDEGERSELRQWMSQTMASMQSPDGSWFDFPLYGYHQYYGTAFALLALQECEVADDQAASTMTRR